jgi:hypothetical protein
MNTNIEILLDRTAEYLLKYDASEEGQKCAHEIQDYYEYRPNYILGCLDYARKFAHKAQTIDIDEDPNEFISVANKAYHAWASSMKTQNENMAKNKIRLTESKLKQIVNESVKKALREGQEGVVTENPMVNQLWNELMVLKNGIIKDIMRKYSWGKSSELGKGVMKSIVGVSNAIGMLNNVLQGTTADNADYWDKVYHEQD